MLFFVQPQLVGEGTLLTRDVLAGDVAMWSLAGYLVVRGVLGPLSYSVGTPGGLFSPLLALGAVWGALFHGLADAALPGAGAGSTAFAVVGMAAFFAGVVRAPLTGVALILEMTGATHLATVHLGRQLRGDADGDEGALGADLRHVAGAHAAARAPVRAAATAGPVSSRGAAPARTVSKRAERSVSS